MVDRTMKSVAPSHPGLLTVVTQIHAGTFIVESHAPGATTARTAQTGAEFAAALGGLPLYGRDLRLWLTWPDHPTDQDRLDTNLVELAEVTGATVWVPQRGASVAVLDGCLDLAVQRADGRPGCWLDYRSPFAGPASFASDADGRLVPVGGPVVQSVGGVSVVAVAPGRDPASVDRFRAIWPRPGLCQVDLAPLDDGRLAVPYADGSLLPVGPAELARVLAAAGWAGEDLCLLTPVTNAGAAGTEAHVHALVAALGVDAYIRPPGATLSIQDGHVRVLGPDNRSATWRRMTQPGLPARPPRWRSVDGWLEEAETVDITHPGDTLTTTDTCTVVDAEPDDRPSGVAWLPRPTPVNAEALWLWVRGGPAELASVEGVPAAQLFLIGRLDPDHTDPTRAEEQLRLYAAPGTAVAAARVAPVAPPHLRDLLAAPRTFLLPAGWLDRVRLDATGPATGDPPAADARRSGEPVVLRCVGAAHGIDGVPDDVVTWPATRSGRAYALCPDRRSTPDFVALHRQRPSAMDGGRLLELRLPAGAAIDVPANAAHLAHLPLVRSRLPDLARDAVDLVLPRQRLDQVTIRRAFISRKGSWRAVAVPELPLDVLLSA